MTTDRRGLDRGVVAALAGAALWLTACGDGWTADVEDASGMVASYELIVTVSDEMVRAHSLAGQPRWETRMDGVVVSVEGRNRVFPMSVDAGADLVAVLALDQRREEDAWVLFALDAEDGLERWNVRFETPQPRLGSLSGSTADISSGVAVTDDAVVTVAPNDEVVALDPADGGELWRGNIDGPSSQPMTALTAGGGLVVATDAFGSRGFSLDDGEVVFSFGERTSHLRAPGVVIDDAVYIVSYLSARAIELDGTERWRADLDDVSGRLSTLNQPPMGPALVGDVLVGVWQTRSVTSTLLRAYDREDGHVRWEQEDEHMAVPRQRDPWERRGTVLELDGRPAIASLDVRVLDPDDGSVTRVVHLDRDLERGIVLRDGALIYLDDEVLRSRIVSR